MTDWQARSESATKKIPMVGFAAYSGTGKTTLLTKLIPIFKARGMKVAVLKHAHHNFDIDKPGKDSYELRAAGADEMLIVSDKRLAKIVELSEPLDFNQCLANIDIENVDLILVEGFKKEPIKKIELYRIAVNGELRDFIHSEDSNIVAIAIDMDCDNAAEIRTKINQNLEVLDLNDPLKIVEYIERNLSQFLIKNI